MREFIGSVKWFNSVKGYGFLGREGHSDVFVHFTSIKAYGYRTLNQGDAVTFDIVVGRQGPQAENVERIETVAPVTELPMRVKREEDRAVQRVA